MDVIFQCIDTYLAEVKEEKACVSVQAQARSMRYILLLGVIWMVSLSMGRAPEKLFPGGVNIHAYLVDKNDIMLHDTWAGEASQVCGTF